jgi:hypothetical protein
MFAATEGSNTLENIREPYRAKIAALIEAYSDDDSDHQSGLPASVVPNSPERGDVRVAVEAAQQALRDFKYACRTDISKASYDALKRPEEAIERALSPLPPTTP